MVVAVVVGAESLALLAGMGWPAAVLGCVIGIAVGWTICSPDRTRRLEALIRALRGGSDSERKR
jgi:membrane associated rhomboid family serine protease